MSHLMLEPIAVALARSGGASISSGELPRVVKAYANALRSANTAAIATAELLSLACTFETRGQIELASLLRGFVVAAEPQLTALAVTLPQPSRDAKSHIPLDSGVRPEGTTAASPLARFALR